MRAIAFSMRASWRRSLNTAAVNEPAASDRAIRDGSPAASDIRGNRAP
jgi:hypothetical protein